MSNSDTAVAKKKSRTKLIIALVILAVTLIFIFSNRSTATLHFLAFEFIAPGWLWFLVVLAAGVVIGSIFPWLRKRTK